jgi:hypothetical protein
MIQSPDCKVSFRIHLGPADGMWELSQWMVVNRWKFRRRLEGDVQAIRAQTDLGKPPPKGRLT